MQIKNEVNGPKYPSYEELKVGETFILPDNMLHRNITVFMKVSLKPTHGEREDPNNTCLRLNDGILCRASPNDKCIRVDSEMIIK